MKPAIIRAARGLINWSQEDLAAHAGLSQTGIARIETGVNEPIQATVNKIKQALTENGVVFIEGEGCMGIMLIED